MFLDLVASLMTFSVVVVDKHNLSLKHRLVHLNAALHLNTASLDLK